MNIHQVFFPLRNNGSDFGGSIYQKVNDKLETAVTLAWTSGNSGTRFGIAAKYQLDPSASISVSSPPKAGPGGSDGAVGQVSR